MSFRSHHSPCHRRPVAGCPKRPRHCPPSSADQACGSRNGDPCGRLDEEDTCGASGGGCPVATGNNPRNSNNPPTGNTTKNVEQEVDRLVDCAKAWTEKEKFKLKQFYEEEIARKKKAVIQEFKCAMEREVIGPLKTRLCGYEREIQELRKQLEAAEKCPQVQIEISELKG